MQASALPASASAACSRGIFLETSRAATIDFRTTPGVLQLRASGVDLAAVRRAADEKLPLSLNLFPDVCLVATATSTEVQPGRVIWTGRIPGAPDGSAVTLVLADDVLIGSVEAAGPAFYQVRYAGNGVHALMRIDPAVYPPD